MHTAIGTPFTATDFHVWEHKPTYACSQLDLYHKPKGQIPSAWASKLHHFAVERTLKGENKQNIIIKKINKTPFL